MKKNNQRRVLQAPPSRTDERAMSRIIEGKKRQRRMTPTFEVNEESFASYFLTPPANAAPPLNAGDRSGRKSTVCDVNGTLRIA
jgi:hypothetical protein